jgi:hypothetical protein
MKLMPMDPLFVSDIRDDIKQQFIDTYLPIITLKHKNNYIYISLVLQIRTRVLPTVYLRVS